MEMAVSIVIPTPKKDWMDDLKALITFAVGGFNFRGLPGGLRVVGIGCFLYGVGIAGSGIYFSQPFSSYDFAALFILASAPILLVASIAEKSPRE